MNWRRERRIESKSNLLQFLDALLLCACTFIDQCPLLCFIWKARQVENISVLGCTGCMATLFHQHSFLSSMEKHLHRPGSNLSSKCFNHLQHNFSIFLGKLGYPFNAYTDGHKSDQKDLTWIFEPGPTHSAPWHSTTNGVWGGGLKPCMGRFGEVVGWCKRRRRRGRVGGQPSLLTLIKGHPGAFNNPCASNAGEGGNDTGYHSPEPTEKITVLTTFTRCQHKPEDVRIIALIISLELLWGRIYLTT